MADEIENKIPSGENTDELSESELNDVAGGHSAGGGGGAGKVSLQDIHFTAQQTNAAFCDGSVKPASDVLV